MYESKIRVQNYDKYFSIRLTEDTLKKLRAEAAQKKYQGGGATQVRTGVTRLIREIIEAHYAK